MKDASPGPGVAHRGAARPGAVLVAALGLALAGCTAASPSASAERPGSPVPTASRPPGPSTGPTGATFDPAAVEVSLEHYATVPGGPLAITAPHDGSGRLFIAAQDGRAWVVRDGVTGSTPLIDLRTSVTSGGERGLLGIAVHPGFPTDPRVFVDYTDRGGNTVVASYTIDPADPDRLDPATATTIIEVGQPFANHNGGALAFGPDGDLYVSLGDGGGGGDPHGNGQKLDTTLGKILRLDIDHPGNGLAYGIPAGNPFTGNPLAHPEIWLYGLRNPWRMAFDRATGALWIGDVGQGAWEEVDVDPAGVGGLNFGWNTMEGNHCYQPASGCNQDGLTPPVAEYGHDKGCVVIGGVVYRGPAYPELVGAYLFTDYCTGGILALRAADPAAPMARLGEAGQGIAAFGEDEAGEVYTANLDGTISRISASARP
jgi:glucose/arabinose dehydrogenase